jgi:hypothetical protein
VVVMRHIDLFSLLFVIWIAILLFFGATNDPALFVILILIGFLVLRELFDISLPTHARERLDFFLYVGVIFFFIVVAQKVLEIIQ